MERYHFHVQNDTSFLRDESGMLLADRASAERQAREIAAGILADELVQGKEAIHLLITIDRADGPPVAIVSATAMFKVGAAPHPS